MPVTGIPIQPRELARLCHEIGGWVDTELVVAVAVCLSESGGYVRAWHDNLDSDGKLLSRDIGLFQINIPASAVGTAVEEDLYDIENNLNRARSLYDNRGWQPWFGWVNGYATSTEWWHWSDTKKLWVPTGRYLHRAVRGVANFYAVHFGLEPRPFTDYWKIPDKPTEPPA